MSLVAALAMLLPGLFWNQDAGTAGQVQAAGFSRIYVPPDRVSDWKDARVEVHSADELKSYSEAIPPRTEMRHDVASATSVPWIDANGWRFQLGTNRAFYAKLPPGAAALAAAEAHAYGIDAVLEPDPEDLPALGSMMRFLKSAGAPRMPIRANIAIVNNSSPLLAEVLNLLGRRNLLYKIVTARDPKTDLNVLIGSKDYPAEAAEDPNLFAAQLRAKIGDDKRLLRIYNTYTVIGLLTGDALRGRLYLLNYSRRPALDVHIRLLGSYRRVRLADSTDATMQAVDERLHDGGTEFTIPKLATYSIVDLER